MKIKTILSIALLSCCISPLFAQVAKKVDPELKKIEDRLNNDEMTGREQNMIFEELHSYWDTRLNKSYQNFLTHYKGKPNFLEKIKISQRAWIAYRDAFMDCSEYCLSQGDKKNAVGQWFNSNRITTLYDLTKNRCIEIEELLEVIKDNDL